MEQVKILAMNLASNETVVDENNSVTTTQKMKYGVNISAIEIVDQKMVGTTLKIFKESDNGNIKREIVIDLGILGDMLVNRVLTELANTEKREEKRLVEAEHIEELRIQADKENKKRQAEFKKEQAKRERERAKEEARLEEERKEEENCVIGDSTFTGMRNYALLGLYNKYNSYNESILLFVKCLKDCPERLKRKHRESGDVKVIQEMASKIKEAQKKEGK